MNDDRSAWLARRIRVSGVIVLAGIGLVAGSLYWNSPSSFLLVNGAGAFLIVVAVGLYFMTLVRYSRP